MKNQGYLTTHVLDMVSGAPAAKMKIELFEIDGNSRKLLSSVFTNEDGRCEKPILEQGQFKTGCYELLFFVADYFAAMSAQLPSGQFLDIVPVRFMITDEASHYHVPLLVSPYGYSTYRGS